MIGYKDMTFCPFHADCIDAPGCHRAFTDDVADGASRSGMGVCSFSAKPPCHRTVKTKRKAVNDGKETPV